MKYQTIKGTFDRLPEDAAGWSYVLERAKLVLERSGAGEIHTPVFEDVGVFSKAVGESSDIVRKEMYTFTDKGERNLCLRPEATASIVRMAAEHRMIEPFEPGQVKTFEGKKIVSYGTSSYGYDIRCSNEFKIFTNINSTIVDPKNFDEKSFVDFKGEVCIIPPNSFALARTVEYFRIPRSVLTVCLGKSTYARCGIIVNVTPFEPEWEGYVTLEFSNTTPLPAKIYAGEGCAQVLFFESDEVCETSYKDRGGKYQGQKGVTLPKM